ncbi:conserved hypothetical protein [Bacillus pumilus]
MLHLTLLYHPTEIPSISQNMSFTCIVTPITRKMFYYLGLTNEYVGYFETIIVVSQ